MLPLIEHSSGDGGFAVACGRTHEIPAEVADNFRGGRAVLPLAGCTGKSVCTSYLYCGGLRGRLGFGLEVSGYAIDDLV